MRYNDDLMRWYVGTSRGYDAIPYGDIDENGCYFLLDTQEIRLDHVSYPSIIIFYSGEKPTSPSKYRLYFNTETLEVAIWDGLKWIVMYSSANSELISADIEAIPITRAVDGITVSDYAKRMLIESIQASAEFYKLAYNEERHRLEIIIGSMSPERHITITGIGNRIITDSYSGDVYLLDEYNTILSTVNFYPKHIISGVFNTLTLNIDFQFSSGSPLSIPAGQLMNMIKGEASATISTTTESGRGLNMRVKRSRETDNQLKLETDGIYYSYINYMDLLNPGLKDAIFIADNTGAPSGTTVKTISTAFITRGMAGDENKLVTEYVVWNAITPVMDRENYTKKEAIWNMSSEDDRVNFAAILGMNIVK